MHHCCYYIAIKGIDRLLIQGKRGCKQAKPGARVQAIRSA